MATDIVGYSRLTGADEEGTLATLRALRRDLINRVVEQHHGRVIKGMGDGLLVEFASTVEAVRCAVAFQQAMAARNAGEQANKRIDFRVGINCGDVIVEDDGDLLGDAVNIAARLEGVASAGGIALSEDAWRQTRGKIGIEFINLGERTLKNIAMPVRVYAATPAALSAPTSSAVTQAPHPPLPDKPSIAVMPLLNLGGDPDQEYLADAIAEDITTALSRWRWFFVISRNSAFVYKGRATDAKRIGRELGVRYLLEGSVRRSRNRVRVSAQLIDVVTSAHIWADYFDRELADIFALEDEITESVVSAIEPAMLHSEEARIARKSPRDLSAFDCFLRGMWHLNKLSEEGYRDALALFRQCIERDPDLSLGYIGLARALYGRVIDGWSVDPVHDLNEAAEVARMALALDARDAHAHFALSGALLYLGRHEQAFDEAEAAIALNPNFAFAHFRLGQVRVYLGEPAEAVPSIERSIRHSPHDPQLGSMITMLALSHYHASNYAEAIRCAQQALNLHDFNARAVLAASLARLGRNEEARSTFAEYLPLLSQQHRLRVSLAPYARAADRDHLLEGLRLAGLNQERADAIAPRR